VIWFAFTSGKTQAAMLPGIGKRTLHRKVKESRIDRRVNTLMMDLKEIFLL